MSLPSDPNARKAIKGYLDEISNAMTRIASERDFIKDALNDVCEKHELNKKSFRKLAKTYHKRNISTEVAEHEEFITMYEQITGESTEQVS